MITGGVLVLAVLLAQFQSKRGIRLNRSTSKETTLAAQPGEPS